MVFRLSRCISSCTLISEADWLRFTLVRLMKLALFQLIFWATCGVDSGSTSTKSLHLTLPNHRPTQPQRWFDRVTILKRCSRLETSSTLRWVWNPYQTPSLISPCWKNQLIEKSFATLPPGISTTQRISGSVCVLKSYLRTSRLFIMNLGTSNISWYYKVSIIFIVIIESSCFFFVLFRQQYADQPLNFK